ncbi:hypothetical protein FOL47_004276, partial [Perkinsus chesapeaki]
PSKNRPSARKRLALKTAGRPQKLRGTPHVHTHREASAALEHEEWMANIPRMTADEPGGSNLDSFLEDPIKVVPFHSQPHRYRLPTPRVLFKRKEGALPPVDCPKSSIVSTIPPQSSEMRLRGSELMSPIINDREGYLERRLDSELPG